jgi:hypothetical protein
MTLPTNKNLEALFDLAPLTPAADAAAPAATTEQQQQALEEINVNIDKIDAALPSVRGLDASDAEMDAIAKTATETFDDLMNFGMNVDPRHAAEIFAVASAMLGHALTAKTAKLNKKLKMVDLQMKKLKLDRDGQDPDSAPNLGEGRVLSRNELLDKLTNRDQKSN